MTSWLRLCCRGVELQGLFFSVGPPPWRPLPEGSWGQARSQEGVDGPAGDSPDAVEDIAIAGDPQQLVVCGDLVEVGPLLVGEEQVRFPDGIQHGRVQVQRVIGVFIVGQTGVVPLLPQKDVDPVVLQPGEKEVEAGSGPGCQLSEGCHLSARLPQSPPGGCYWSVVRLMWGKT